MKTLPEIRKELKDIVADGLDLVFAAIKAYLNSGTDKYNEVIEMEGRYREISKQLVQDDIISNEEARREFNKLRKAVLGFIDSLTEEDLPKEGGDSEDAPPNIYNGEVFYRIPKEMKVQEEVKCIVRVAFTRQALLKGLEQMEEDVVDDIRISDVMGVELFEPSADKHFEIRGISDTVQYVEKDLPTEWQFYVKPMQEGTYPLVLKITVVEIKNGIERKKNTVLEVIVQIVATEPKPDAAGQEFISSGQVLNFAGAQGIAANIPKGPSIPQSPSPMSPAPSPAMPAPRSSFPLRKLSMVMSVFVVLILATWAMSNLLKPPDPVQVDWNKTVAENSKPGFEEFVDKHPSAPEVVIAREKLDSIETAAWQGVLASVEAASLSALYGSTATAGVIMVYLKEYPNGRYVTEALLFLEKINKPKSKNLIFSWQLLDTVLRVSHEGGFAPFQFSLIQDGKPQRQVKRESIGKFEVSLKSVKPGGYQLKMQDSEGRIATANITIKPPTTAGDKQAIESTKGVAIVSTDQPPKPPVRNNDVNNQPPPDPNAPVKFADRMPVYKGCSNSKKDREANCTKRKIRQFVDSKLKYPRQALDRGIEGTVTVNFVIEKDGTLTAVKAENDIGGGCAAEAERIVKQMPKFLPGLNANGVAVRVSYSLPITFKLQ